MGLNSDPISFDWAGQALALDLADTLVVVRPGQVVDVLSTPAELGHWLATEQDRLGTPGRSILARHSDFVALRDAIHMLFAKATEGQPLPAGAVRTINRVAALAPETIQLGPSGTLEKRTLAADRTAEILATIARSAIEILGGPDCERLRRCEAPRCGMFYLAVRARQTWCTPMCGNRARVARHYARLMGGSVGERGGSGSRAAIHTSRA